jgi:hypothetical protein
MVGEQVAYQINRFFRIGINIGVGPVSIGHDINHGKFVFDKTVAKGVIKISPPK